MWIARSSRGAGIKKCNKNGVDDKGCHFDPRLSGLFVPLCLAAAACSVSLRADARDTASCFLPSLPLTRARCYPLVGSNSPSPSLTLGHTVAFIHPICCHRRRRLFLFPFFLLLFFGGRLRLTSYMCCNLRRFTSGNKHTLRIFSNLFNA